MKKLIATAFAASVMLGGIGLAQAMPLAPVTPQDNVIQVAGGCGPGWHRGPHGGCRRNWARPARHACPRGYHLGPGGRCRGNY